MTLISPKTSVPQVHFKPFPQSRGVGKAPMGRTPSLPEGGHGTLSWSSPERTESQIHKRRGTEVTMHCAVTKSARK